MRWKDGEASTGRFRIDEQRARATMTDDVERVARTIDQCIVLLRWLKNDHDGLDDDGEEEKRREEECTQTRRGACFGGVHYGITGRGLGRNSKLPESRNATVVTPHLSLLSHHKPRTSR